MFELARRGKLPSVTDIEPNLTDIPPGGDDHPPSDIAAGQALIKRIYDALAGGPPEQWQKTLLIITYDEHGSFYDYVTRCRSDSSIPRRRSRPASH